MKQLGLIFSMFICFTSTAQFVSVNTSTYTVPQLVTDVLVNKPCVQLSNINFRTGTNFGSSNGIGYFTNTNPAFPLASGVVLSTGNVLNVPGPNSSTLNDGNLAWSGDTDLQNALLAAGITMNSTNATVLEFDFVPFSPNFNFQFLFASEEYGNFQCQFSDAFAFLLTNVATGVTTNLAVVPSTTDPISVTTIRNSLYNSNCGSVNPSYFGAFNGGSNAAAAPINFNGQTVVMNANSNSLVPNTTYRIKLVVADRQDFQSDSAIFLGANSFNIGQDVLGTDLTVTANSAVCFNDTTTLTSGLNPAIYSFAWTLNGNPIGGNTANLTVNQPGTYGLTYTIIATNCTVTTDFINVEYQPEIVTPNPVNLLQCDNASANYTFDLGFNTNILNTTGIAISYHNTLLEAQSGANPLPTNLSTPVTSLPRTIFVRFLNTSTNCIATKTFQLQLTAPPIANNPGNFTVCATGVGSLEAIFPIATLTNTVLGAQSPVNYLVSYHPTLIDATNNVNPIASPFTTANTSMFIRVQNATDSSCFNITSIDLIVRLIPQVDPIQNQYVCTSFILPTLVNGGNYYTGPNQGLPILPVGTVITTDTTVYIYNETGGIPNCSNGSSFFIDIVEQPDIEVLDTTVCDTYTVPSLGNTAQFYTQPGGPTGTGTLVPTGTILTAIGTTTLHIYFTSLEMPPCVLESSYNITILQTPTIPASFPNLFNCVQFDSFPALTVGNYFTFDSLSGIYSPVIFPVTTTTPIYVFATNGICQTPIRNFTAYVNTLGLPNINVCNSYDLLPIPIGEYRTAPNGGGTIINPGLITQSITVYTFVPGAGTPNCTDDDFFDIIINGPFVTDPIPVTECASFTLPNQPENAQYFTLSGGPATIGNVELFPTGVITTTTTIFVYKLSTSLVGCFTEKPWTITINQRPIIDSRADVESCDSYTLTPLSNGNYFDEPNGVSPLAAGTVITADNTIYIFAANTTDPTCFSQNSFNIILNGVIANAPPTQLTWCDTFTFPPLPTAGNFYYTATGGPNGTGSIIPVGTTVNSTTVLPIYYIFYETGDRLNCSNERSFSITINNTPVITPAVPTVINACNSFTLPTLTIGQYFTEPNGGGTLIDNTTPVTFTSSQPTIYIYAQTNTTPNCTVNQPLKINIFNVDEPTSVTRCANFTLPILPAGQQYFSQTGGVGLITNPVINTTQNIFVFGFSGFTPNCSDEHQFTVTIVPRPIADSVSTITTCDTFGENDGVFEFDLTTLAIRNDVLNGATPDADFTLSFYTSFADANNPLAVAIANPSQYQNDNALIDSVFIRVTNTTLTDPCFAIVEMPLQVVLLPQPFLEPEYFICSDYEKGTLLNPVLLNSQLSGSNLVFTWTFNGAPIGGNTSTLLANEAGNYTLSVNNTSTICTSETITTTVTSYAPYIELVYSDAFQSPSYVTINVLGAGSGQYQYQLGNSSFQNSNTFYNVLPGNYEVTVRDITGLCAPAPTKAFIINYPKYFTPNADGFHDTWNITSLKDTNPDAPIFIFDRYGKLLKQINPSINGWDGTFNGAQMPSDDYWFTVDFKEKGATKTFKAHFALKR